MAVFLYCLGLIWISKLPCMDLGSHTCPISWRSCHCWFCLSFSMINGSTSTLTLASGVYYLIHSYHVFYTSLCLIWSIAMSTLSKWITCANLEGNHLSCADSFPACGTSMGYVAVRGWQLHRVPCVCLCQFLAHSKSYCSFSWKYICSGDQKNKPQSLVVLTSGPVRSTCPSDCSSFSPQWFFRGALLFSFQMYLCVTVW